MFLWVPCRLWVRALQSSLDISDWLSSSCLETQNWDWVLIILSVCPLCWVEACQNMRRLTDIRCVHVLVHVKLGLEINFCTMNGTHNITIISVIFTYSFVKLLCCCLLYVIGIYLISESSMFYEFFIIISVTTTTRRHQLQKNTLMSTAHMICKVLG